VRKALLENYGLARGYFTLNPREEHDVYLGPRSRDADLSIGHLRRTMRAERAPKAIVYGVFGVGKTQFTYYVMHKLSDLSRSVYVECPPFHRRSRFTELHNVIMRRLGREYVLSLLDKAFASTGGSRSLSKTLNLEEDLVSTIRSGFESDHRALLWRYLTGEKLKSSEVDGIDAVRAQIYEDDAVSILNSVALQVKAFESKQLLLFIDEIENTEPLSGDSLGMFREALRGLVDEGNSVGVVFTASGREMADLPVCITDESVKRRIGMPNYINFKEYTHDELKQFIHEVIQYRRAKDFDASSAARRVRVPGENVTVLSYPFTEEAISSIVLAVTNLRDTGQTDAVRPKEALSVMDNALAYALEKRAPAIDSQLVSVVSKVQETEEVEK